MTKYDPDMIGILDRLVGFPTVSNRSNKDLIAYVEDYLKSHGVDCHIVPDPTGEKLGLIAHIGPKIDGGVLLSGHTDVVPVEGQTWATDPWKLTHRDGKYYGRGTCDMKGFVALVLAAVPDMVAAPLSRPIQLALSFDEEIGCLGTPYLLEALADKMPKAQIVLVGEPSEMGLVTGHKGGLGLKTRITGKAAHSSRPDIGVSAIEAASQLIEWHRFSTELAEYRAQDTGFLPPYSTAQVGTIHGGIAVTTIPEHCVLETDIRFVPPETADAWIARYRTKTRAVEKHMQEKCKQASIEVSVSENIPALRSDPDGQAARMIRQITGDNGNQLVSYQTEAGHFQAAGFSTAICGPGSIEQAHGPDEFISSEQLRQGQDFLARLIKTLC